MKTSWSVGIQRLWHPLSAVGWSVAPRAMAPPRWLAASAALLAASISWSTCQAADTATTTPETPKAVADQTPPPTPPPFKWSDRLNLGIVKTAGNTVNTNFEIANDLRLAWPNSNLELKVQLLRVETGKRNIEADFTDPSRPILSVNWDREKTTELYEGRMAYHRRIHERFGWFVRAGYSQNEPAGYDTRSSLGAGLSNTRPGPDGRLLRFEAGLSGNRDHPTNGENTSYFGAREALRYEVPVLSGGRFEGEIELLQDLGDSQNHRARLDLALSAALSRRFALKISYQVRYDHQPQERVYPNPEPSLGPNLVFTFNEFDSVFSTSLVASF